MDATRRTSAKPGLLALTGLALALTLACGGGGSGSSTPPPATPANPAGWNGAQALEASKALASTYPVVAMDATGNAFAAWQKAVSTANAVWGNDYLLSAAGWKTDQALSAQSTNCQDIQVAGDGQGNYLYAWDTVTTPNATTGVSTYAVYVNTDSVQGPGATPTQLGTGSSFRPAVALSANGSACAVWSTEGTTFAAVWASLYNPATHVWSSPQQLSTTTAADAVWPSVAMDSAGNATVMWAEGVLASSAPKFVLQVASYKPATPWSAPVATVTSGDLADTSFSLAMSDFGAQAAWAESSDGGNTYVVRTMRWTAAGSGWSTAAAVSATGGAALLPVVGLDAKGNALLAWTTGATSLYAPNSIYYATANPAGAWQAPQALLSGTNGVEGLALAMNAGGSAVLAFNQWDTSTWRISAAILTGTNWAPPVYIQTSTGGNADMPSVAMNSGGQAMVVWDQPDSAGLTHIYANHYQ